MYPIANPSAGWKWDLWFPDNEAYFFVNDDQNNLNFNSYTNPSSLSGQGARTYINIYDIKYLDNSSLMRFMFIFVSMAIYIHHIHIHNYFHIHTNIFHLLH